MYMIRGKVNRWGPGLRQRAIGDLRVDYNGLSVFRVADKDDAQLIAAAFALAFKEESRHEWILFPEECVEQFGVIPDPDENLPSPLKERHCLVKILESQRSEFANTLCDHSQLDKFVQQVRDVCTRAPELIARY